MLLDSGLLAGVTALHVAVAVVRRHRAGATSAFSPFVLPSFVFAVSPWVWSSGVGLGIGIAAHVAWCAVCEVLTPTAAVPGRSRGPRPQDGRSALPTPAPTVTTSSRQVPSGAGGFVSTSVLAVLDEARDIKTFRLARPDGFEFLPGQFLAVRVLVDGKPHVRCYSISSPPDTRGYLEISVRRQGLVSTMLHASTRTGSRLSINPPAGRFVYPSSDDRPLALVAGGIGITPLLSMLRHALAADPTRPVALFYSARNRESLAFLSELRVIAERHPQVRIGITLSDDANAPAPWRRGRIDGPLIRQFVAHPAHTIFCVCGPDPMMAAMQELLRSEGVPAEQIRSEHFSTAMAAASLNDAAARPAAGAVAGGGYRLTFAASGREVMTNPAQTLLEAAEAEGISIASSCRSGVCQACRTRLVDGNADCRSSVLDSDDRAAGFVLPCVTYAVSDCVLEA